MKGVESKLGRACVFAFSYPLAQEGQNVRLSWHLTWHKSTCIGVRRSFRGHIREALLVVTIYYDHEWFDYNCLTWRGK